MHYNLPIFVEITCVFCGGTFFDKTNCPTYCFLFFWAGNDRVKRPISLGDWDSWSVRWERLRVGISGWQELNV